MFGEGISQTGELVDLGAELGILTKSGAWYSYNSEKIGQGREACKNYLKSNPEVMAEINRKVRDALGLTN